MRFRIHIPSTAIPAAANSQIYVYQAGTTSQVPDPIYADATSTTVLGQGYTHPGGDIVFFRNVPDGVTVGVKAPSSPTIAVSPLAHAAQKVFSYGLLKQGGRVVDWIVG